MRPDASENSQINPPAIVRASRAAGRHPHLASVLLQGRKSADIHASSGVIRGIPVEISPSAAELGGTESVSTPPAPTTNSRTVAAKTADWINTVIGSLNGWRLL